MSSGISTRTRVPVRHLSMVAVMAMATGLLVKKNVRSAADPKVLNLSYYKVTTGLMGNSTFNVLESVCDLPADRGKCKGKFDKWYFEKATGTCVTFIYGGCQGNRNRFNNQHDCEAKCVRHKTSPLLLPPTHRPLEPSDQPETSLPYLCTLNKDSGPCVDWSPKWFYDFATGSCDRFHYGGNSC